MNAEIIIGTIDSIITGNPNLTPTKVTNTPRDTNISLLVCNESEIKT